MDILRQVVARCHVSDSTKEVLTYAKSRLRKGFWNKMTFRQKVNFAKFCKAAHLENRELYRSVMKGI